MFDKANISIGISFIALAISLLSYCGPQQNAKERMEVHMHAVKLFARTRPADCQNTKDCEDWAEIVSEMGDIALEELEKERPQLSASAYKNFYKEIMIPYNEAKWMLTQRDNPDIGKHPLDITELTGEQMNKVNALDYVEGKGIHK